MPPPQIPFAPKPIFETANLEEVLEKMQWCFHIRPFWQAKLWRVIKTDQSDHLSHVFISIFIVFLLRSVCAMY